MARQKSERGRMALLGAVLVLGGLVGCAARPLVMTFPPPKDPITSLDVVEEGNTELSANVASTLLWGLGEDISGPPFDLIMLAPGFGVGATHGLGRFELRARSGMTLLSWQASAGLGYRLPRAGRWDFVAGADLASWKYSSTFKVPDQSEWDPENPNRSYEARGPGSYPYSYRMFTPSAQVRAIWAPKPQLRVPIALRVGHSSAWAHEGLYDFELKRQEYISLTAGVIWKAERSCLSAGAGVTLDQLFLPAVQGSLGCEIDWRKLKEQVK